MNPLSFVHRHGGVIRSSRLRQAGCGSRLIQAEVKRGRLIRPKKGWLALPDADPDLVFAARHGALLSCITQARRLGLWTLSGPEIHLAAMHPGSRVVPHEGITHWARPLVPRAPGSLTDPVENVLALMATCCPREQVIIAIDSALNRGLVTLPSLERLPLNTVFRELLSECSPFADSGLETIFRTRLRWLRVHIRAQSWVLGHRVDLLIGQRLVVQIDGGHHVGPQRDRDMAHDARLALEGYHVLRFSYAQIVRRWEEVQEAVLGAVARGLHLDDDELRRR